MEEKHPCAYDRTTTTALVVKKQGAKVRAKTWTRLHLNSDSAVALFHFHIALSLWCSISACQIQHEYRFQRSKAIIQCCPDHLQVALLVVCGQVGFFLSYM